LGGKLARVNPAETLAAHDRVQSVAWRVGEEIALPTKEGVRGFPGVDGALQALATLLRRGRFHPAGRGLDLTQSPGALAAWSRAVGNEAIWTTAVTSAAVARLLPDDPNRRIAAPWDVAGAFDTIVWRPPAERGVQRVAIESSAVARLLAPGGVALLIQHKDEGAERTIRAAQGAFAAVETIGREAGWRVVTLRLPQPASPPEPWLTFDAPGGIARALVGTFAAGKVDVGTAALLRARAAAGPTPPRVLDLGCGSGLLARAAATSGARAVLAVDDDVAAVASAAANVASLPHARVRQADLLTPIDGAWGEEPFDEVWCNPPFHVGRQVVGQLSRAFVAAALAALTRDGEAWFVVNRALPYRALFDAWRLRYVDATPAGVTSHTVWRVRQPSNS
jgi:16S rRNA G1207 methylase RsmC